MNRCPLILAATPCSAVVHWRRCGMKESLRETGGSVEQAKEFFEKDYVDNYFQESRPLLKSKKVSLHLHLRNRYFGNRHFATKYRKP